MRQPRGLALLTCVALMGVLSTGLLTLTLLAKTDVLRTRRVTDGAQLRQVLMAVAEQADAAVRDDADLPVHWGLPAELDVKVETFWRVQDADRRVLAIEAAWPRTLVRQVVTWTRGPDGWRLSAAELERGG